jgi:hypothetical protein
MVPGMKYCCDIIRHDFTVEPGVFNLLVGSSSADIRLKYDLQISK